MALQPLLFEPPKRVPPSFRVGPAQATPKPARQILAKGVGRISAYDFTLNPYVGCQFGCSYCFASFFVPDAKRREDWGAWVDVKENALELIRLRRDLGGKSIFLGSATDPYQPVESRTLLTRRILEHLASLSEQPRVVIQTRGPLVARDIDILKRFKKVRVNMSVTTDDDEIRKSFEPNAPTIPARLRALKELREADIKIAVCLSPLLPVRDVIGFAATLNGLRADRYGASFFHTGKSEFTAGTRELAWQKSAAHGWNLQSYRRTLAQLQERLPALLFGPKAFEPE